VTAGLAKATEEQLSEDREASDNLKRSRLAAVLSWLRPVIGIALLAVLLQIVPLRSVLQQLKAADPIPLALGFVVVFAALLTSALKLWLLVRTAVPDAPFLGVLRAYYVGSFFNNFLPTGVGGDIMKIAELTRRRVPAGHGAACVVVERATGVLVVMALASLVSLGRPDLFDQLELPAARWPMAALGLGTFAGLGLAYAAWRGPLKAFLKSRREKAVFGRIYRVISAFYVFRNRPATVADALGLSVVLYGLVAANIVVVARAVSADVPPGTATAILPFVKIPEMLPVSVGALGIREGMLTYCLGRLGLAHAQAFGLALLLRLLTCFHSAIGGCLYALGRRGSRRDPPHAAQKGDPR